ncbi:MAG: AAA family ATPase [Bacillaceae bacterium]|nr:AAA family ATPase [Bacillaceae bacterium]
MSVKDHPDYQEEIKRLHNTQKYIELVIKSSEQNKDVYKGNIKQAFEELDFLDSSQSYINILTNSRFLEMSERDIHNLKNIQDKPYFARIDFQPEQADQPEKLYIGKTSLYRKEDQKPVIIDWRSPVANVYYEGRIGDVSYQTETGSVNGHLSLKRQYLIENGQLEEIRDIDITTRDEMLQESLGANADNRLKDIVSTIQAEQNQIIRAEMDRPLIVQGVAGSGKTTIALHRIAYFIYTYADRFDPDQFMILAPNRLFIHYISEVLPELGVEDVKQTTFVDFVREAIGKKFRMTDPDDKLLQFVNEGPRTDQKELNKEHEKLKWVSSFKGSITFKELIDRYLDEIEQQFLPGVDFKLGKRVIYPADDIARLFFQEYRYLPLYKRLDQIKKVLANHLKTKKKEFLQEVDEKYDEKMDQARYKIRDPELRRKKIVRLMDKKEALLMKIETNSKTLVKTYMSRFPKYDLYHYYRQLFQDEATIHRLASRALDENHVRFLCEYSNGLLEKKRFEFEDTAALLYLQHKLFGLKNNSKIKNLVIDEAQDFSVFQLLALKEVLDTDLFTILGDLSQGIHAYRGISDWKDVVEHVFPDGNANYLTLEQSYRTTVEIMNLANQVIRHAGIPDEILARPVVRHGKKPVVIPFEKKNGFVTSIVEKVSQVREEGFRSIALIGKSLDECKKIKTYMDQHGGISTQLLKGEEEVEGDDVVIVPSYVAKGLEFDAVFVVNIDDVYTDDELDVKLLYVAMTRPLHRLFIYYRENRIPLLNRISDEYYEVE